MGIEFATNVRGERISFFTPRPSNDAQNYHLDSKYLTRDCPKCRSFIPREEALSIVDKASQTTRHAWTPPSQESVQGICTAGKYLKVLEIRPKGAIHCGIKIKPQ